MLHKHQYCRISRIKNQDRCAKMNQHLPKLTWIYVLSKVSQLCTFIFLQMERYFCFSTAADLKGKTLHFALTPNCACGQGKQKPLTFAMSSPQNICLRKKTSKQRKNELDNQPGMRKRGGLIEG